MMHVFAYGFAHVEEEEEEEEEEEDANTMRKGVTMDHW